MQMLATQSGLRPADLLLRPTLWVALRTHICSHMPHSFRHPPSPNNTLHTTQTQVKGLLEIVSAASEFDTLPMRPGEETSVQKMISHAPVAVDKPRFSDPHTKVNALLQAHFSRERLGGDLGNDTRSAVREAARLLQVRVCVLFESGCACVRVDSTASVYFLRFECALLD